MQIKNIKKIATDGKNIWMRAIDKCGCEFDDLIELLFSLTKAEP